MGKKLRTIIIILLVILLSLISFAGIYLNKTGRYQNVIPDYVKGSDLLGKRITNLTVSDETIEKILDANGQEVSEIPEDANQDDYTTTEESLNKEENLTQENYKKVKDIIEKRLNYIGVQDYNIKQNLENGDIVVEFPEDDETDNNISYLISSGSFQIIDSDTEEILMDNNDVENASVVYGTTTSGITVYLDVKFTKDGQEKIKEISNNYKKVEDTENETQKTITIMLNEQQFLKTYFGEEITNGELTISIGNSTNDKNEIYELTEEAKIYVMMINSGVMPITYEYASSEYVESSITNQEQLYIIYALIVIVALSILYLILKYKVKGLYSSIVYIFSIAIFLLAIRYTGTTIMFSSLFAALILIIFNDYININILNKIKNVFEEENIIKEIKNSYLYILNVAIVLLIISIVLTFSSYQIINALGMMLFYGIISIALSQILNFIMLTTVNKNK